MHGYVIQTDNPGIHQNANLNLNQESEAGLNRLPNPQDGNYVSNSNPGIKLAFYLILLNLALRWLARSAHKNVPNSELEAAFHMARFGSSDDPLLKIQLV